MFGVHDTNVLFHALKNDHDKFPHPPKGMHGWILFFSYCFQIILHAPRNIFKFPYLYSGKYYHVDARYPNRHVCLAPYKGERYHVPDWRRALAPSGEQEQLPENRDFMRGIIFRESLKHTLTKLIVFVEVL